MVEAPGHSPGAVAFWRDRDRCLIIGDVISNVSMRGSAPRLRNLPAFLHSDADTNADSLRKLAALRPAVVGFGHGLPLRDPGLIAEGFASLTS